MLALGLLPGVHAGGAETKLGLWGPAGRTPPHSSHSSGPVVARGLTLEGSSGQRHRNGSEWGAGRGRDAAAVGGSARPGPNPRSPSSATGGSFTREALGK